jgi:hypothetical protein
MPSPSDHGDPTRECAQRSIVPFMSHSAGAPPERGWQRFFWWIFALATPACLILGFVAYWFQPEKGPVQPAPAPAQPNPEGLSRIAEVLYQSVQLLTLHGHAEAGGWQFHIAQVLAVAVISSTVVLALLTHFEKRGRLFWIRHFGEHVVICGLGRNGLQLVKEFAVCKTRSIAVEHHPDNENVSTAEGRGALVLIESPASRRVLRRAATDRAKYLIAICEDDGVNVGIATQATRLIRNSKKRAAAHVQCFVHIVDLQLRTLFEQHRIFSAKADGMKIKVFNIYENSARLLLAKNPIDPVGMGASDPRRVHLIVFGFGQMGQSVALQAAKLGHYANGKKLRITVIDRLAAEKKHSFYYHYPFFSEVCDVEFLDWDAEDLEKLEKVREWTSEEASVCTCVICFDSDSRALAFALKLLKIIPSNVPIRVRMQSSKGLGSLLAGNSETSNLPGRLTSFGVVSDACTIEMVVGEKLDALARAIHEDFVKKRKGEQRRADEDPSIQPWEQLDQIFIDSNRQQADHIDVKLRAIKCDRSQLEKAKETGFSDGEIELMAKFFDAEIEMLAKMEHARWRAERRLAGWSFAPGKSNLEAKTSPYIEDWESIPDDVKEYDREAVKNIPHLLKAMRQRIYG